MQIEPRSDSDSLRAAKLEARQCFTRENQKKKLGITGDPSLHMLWHAFMQCYQRIKARNSRRSMTTTPAQGMVQG